MKTVAFRTQARTVDHLGREQIADCPTAISELWKNAYDAYAESVALHIFDGPEPVAGVFDDGHGMSYDEFINRWLVVGTESKYSEEIVSDEDRNGLKPRTRQGQKGIGRLSSANLGPLLLLVSKRKNSNFVAALIDWRIFENPFLTLEDIRVPVTEFERKEELFELLPELFEGLTENIWGNQQEPDRALRIEAAWSAYDSISNEGEKKDDKRPSEIIAKTLIDACFNTKHIEPWPVWSGSKSHGTAMLVSSINFDLKAHISDQSDVASYNARTRLIETLSSFVDPFHDPSEYEINSDDAEFNYSVYAHKDDKARLIVGTDKEFNRKDIDLLEHVLDGYIDSQGVFHGQVKAFGKWVNFGEEYIIPPPKDVLIHTRKDWLVGPASIYIATCEQMSGSSTHTDDEFKRIENWLEQFAGFLIFRNNLRVLPYGRVDNDFFEIETRRTKHAGREFWNARRIFGRLSISRENNPNLIDKAGREGFIDNTAAKTLKAIVENILMRAARDYFGTAAPLRQELLPEIQAKNKEEKAKEERNKLRKKQRKQFRTKLKALNKALPEFVEKLASTEQELSIKSVEDIADAKELIDDFRSELVHFRLQGAPQSLGNLESDYNEYKIQIANSASSLQKISSKIEEAIQRISPPNPVELVEQQRQRNAAHIHNRIRQWRARIQALHNHEAQRIQNLVDDRNKVFHAQTSEIPNQVERGDISPSHAFKLMEDLRVSLDLENEDMFESYIRALESLTESIDLEMLAIGNTEENDELREELDRLNGLAQLGITVEILGHELQSYDDMIGHGIRELPSDLQDSRPVSEIKMGYAGLTNQLRFLSPLKLSGEKIQKWIEGKEIFEYVTSFYGDLMEKKGIRFEASESFLSFRVFDQPSRIFPVFINLVNNSMYWVSNSADTSKSVRLDIYDGEVVVSDSGPGVDKSDVSSLFSLFFTKKLRGGRGIGLYLSKANLTAGGHTIRYLEEAPNRLLKGANFSIAFKGAEFKDEC